MYQVLAKHCLTSSRFDDRANGYTRGEGVGMLLLKHVDDAIRDGDCIRAVIRGTGVNQDGKTPGITLPSSEAQSSLIRSTYASAGLDPADTAYFEAHGTGTGRHSPSSHLNRDLTNRFRQLLATPSKWVLLQTFSTGRRRVSHCMLVR